MMRGHRNPTAQAAAGALPDQAIPLVLWPRPQGHRRLLRRRTAAQEPLGIFKARPKQVFPWPVPGRTLLPSFRRRQPRASFPSLRPRTAGSLAPAADCSCLPNITFGLLIFHHAGTPAVPIFATKLADEDRVVSSCRAPISGPGTGGRPQPPPQAPQREEGGGGPAKHLAPSRF